MIKVSPSSKSRISSIIIENHRFLKLFWKRSARLLRHFMHIPKPSGAFSTPPNPNQATSTVPMVRNVAGVGKEIYGRHDLVTQKIPTRQKPVIGTGLSIPGRVAGSVLEPSKQNERGKHPCSSRNVHRVAQKPPRTFTSQI